MRPHLQLCCPISGLYCTEAYSTSAEYHWHRYLSSDFSSGSFEGTSSMPDTSIFSSDCYRVMVVKEEQGTELTTLETALSWRVLMAVPKSASFRMPPASSRFSGFRSLWMMPCAQRPRSSAQTAYVCEHNCLRSYTCCHIGLHAGLRHTANIHGMYDGESLTEASRCFLFLAREHRVCLRLLVKAACLAMEGPGCIVLEPNRLPAHGDTARPVALAALHFARCVPLKDFLSC